MDELQKIEKKVRPHQVYFVCDALTGQDAVASAGAFNEALELDGVIMTKLDGDARGGAALSVRQVTGVPIKFVGMGEKLDKLDAFDPERIVGQMLGMGDIVGLVEAAKEAVDEEEAKRQQEKLAKGKFDLDDFRQQIVQMKKMGLGQGPHGQDPRHEPDGRRARRGRRRRRGQADPGDHRQHDPRRARATPHMIDISRRRRIAAGAGFEPADVSGLVKQFDAMAAMVKQMSQMTMMDHVRALSGLGKAGAFNPGAMLVAPKQGTGKRLSPKEREKQKKLREKEARRISASSRDSARGGPTPEPNRAGIAPAEITDEPRPGLLDQARRRGDRAVPTD